MVYLLAVSFIWAFSFGLIKNRLAGLDPTAVGVLRIALAFAVFLPFLRVGGTTLVQRLRLAGIGGVQFGLMYILYLHAFRYLKAYEIALFTITTPLFLTLIDAALERRIQIKHWIAAMLSIAGAALLAWREMVSDQLIAGIFFIQLSNFCFAAGQLAYRRFRAATSEPSDASLFGWLYLGALATTGVLSLASSSWENFRPSTEQWLVLAYLGILSSGVCFFWWNKGATRVNTGTLAALNNAKIPLGVACSLLFFGEDADWEKLLMSGSLLTIGVLVAEHKKRQA